MKKKRKAAARPDLIPEPNGLAYRRLLGGKPGGPMTREEAEAAIGRAIDRGLELQAAARRSLRARTR